MTVVSLLHRHRSTLAADLRRRIARIERLAPAGRSAPVRFGLAALDEALPEGGLSSGLHEIAAAPGGNGAALGFAAALAGLAAQERSGPVLWVASGLYGPGLAAFGLTPDRLLLVPAREPKAALWAMEEGLKAKALAAVVGEVAAIGPAAARRLQLAAASSGGFALLLRPEEGAKGTAVAAATTRWCLAPAPSMPVPVLQTLPAPGHPRWQARLLHGRHGARPGEWIVEWNHDDRRFVLAVAVAAALADRPVAPGAGIAAAVGR